MPSRKNISLTLALALLGIFGRPAAGQVAKQGYDTLSSLAFQSDRLAESQPVEPLENHLSAIAQDTQSAWTAFRLKAPVEWSATVDRRTGRIALAEGGGIAWIPGRGNSLTLESLAPVLKPGAKKIDLATMEALARNFLPRVSDLLGVDPESLVLNLGRSGQPASHLWFVDFDVVQEGRTVEGARVVFRINNGNLIQFGSENLPVPGSPVPPVRLSAAEALTAVSRYIGGFSSADSFNDRGSLHLVPANLPEGFDFGAGRELAQVYQLVFHRDGVQGTWQARVDATSGELLELRDVNDYATRQVTGGVRPFGGGIEVVRPLPVITVSPGGTTGVAGLFNWTGVTTTASLSGPYVKITDSCGASSQASDTFGNIGFGASAGTDCTTPGHGGAGNTHAAREQFYVANRFKSVARSWLPTNTWLNQQLRVNVNLNQTCNAYWNGTTLNFFKSGGGCPNGAETADTAIHELGHALDQNDATGSSPDGATGESYADTTSVVTFHKSCIAPGFFFGGGNCSGYGDPCTACTGVRDVDFALHVSNTPATVSNFTQVHCAAGTGPCGKEVHCESYVPSEAIWDFANRDLPGAGTGAAWTILDRLWYLSRNTATGAFVCNHVSMPFTSNGCAVGNLWKVMRAVDDDDGNLNNGTPHGAALYAAFNRHGIACTTDPGASTTFHGCPQPATPTLTVTPGDNSAALSWTASGTAVYDVFKNDTGCNAAFTKIVSGGASTTLADNDVSNGYTYYYQVTAFPSGNEACASDPSPCIAVFPPGACVPPAAPALPSATASTSSVTLAWTPVAGATEYHILRSTISGGPYTPIGDSVGASYTDSTVVAGTTYYYVVRAAKSLTCESGNSPQVMVTVQNFTLSISPFSQTMPGAGTVIYTITITRIGGFSGAVTFSLSSLPATITHTFTPASTTGTLDTLSLTIGATTPPATYPFTVTGTGGTLTRTTTGQVIH